MMCEAKRRMANGAKTARRTQAQRREAGRSALVEASIESLSEKGFGNTTSQDICARANCTTGAIQHHFGSKNGLYIAVLDQLLDEFRSAFLEFPSADEPLEGRLHKTIGVLRSLYTSDRYRATQSLVLGAQHDPELKDLVAHQRRGALDLTRRAWLATFSNVGLSAKQLRSLLEIIVSVLRDYHFNRTVDQDEAARQLELNIGQVERLVLLQLQSRV